MFKKIKAAKAYLEHGDEFAAGLAPDDAVVIDAPSDAGQPAVAGSSWRGSSGRTTTRAR